MRGILIVGDGMADQPLQELNFKTPIEAANPQAMNRLACRGVLGLLDPIAPSVVPSSDTANLALLGYNSDFVYEGRGPFEASGAGLQLKEGDVAFRCNFVTVDENLCLVDERAGRVGGVDAKVLGKVVEQIELKDNSDVELYFKQTLGFKAALVLRGDGLSSKVYRALPNVGDSVVSILPLDGSFEARRTAGVLNEFVQLSNQVLDVHPVNVERKVVNRRPANAVLPWSGGVKPDVSSFQGKYSLRASCVAAVSLIKGIGRLSGMDVPDVLGATGERDTDTLAKADAVLAAFREGKDFVYVHIEAADEASHDGDVEGKIAVIKKIDMLVDRILSSVDLSDTVIALMPDHATSCMTMRHLCDAVPVCFAGANVISDNVTVYSERSAYKGGLSHISGKDIMPMMLNYMGRT
ncbi:MAG: 2,3-bisphosphoglycerate-independent phosphoglycerate mutase [Nitrososphaerota archaeon]|jgi:2,3-bisphosphoglycerate-independent phosphoglycerate mutase|nr:2,3-bisphosphoglycerate-independent phosphoglycerate mutase [Nitrososphaerota archaeon]